MAPQNNASVQGKPKSAEAACWCDHDHEHTSSGSSGMSMEELDQDLMKAGQDAEEKESLCRLRTFHGVADHEALGKEWLGLRWTGLSFQTSSTIWRRMGPPLNFAKASVGKSAMTPWQRVMQRKRQGRVR
jgi:hypothetical protein